MFKTFKSILFATNLSENCRPAFEVAAAMATRYQATLVLLHVLDRSPEFIESRLKGLLGDKQYSDLARSHETTIRQTLIGKKSSNKLVREALEQFYVAAGIDDASCGYRSKEIAVTNGKLVDEILAKSKDYNCDLIIMGASDGFLSDNSIGATIKSVMRRSEVPVMMVPPAHDDK